MQFERPARVLLSAIELIETEFLFVIGISQNINFHLEVHIGFSHGL
jgi:hypothetical protein